MKCAVCGRAWANFAALRLIGYMAGFDEADRPILIEQRNCDGCEMTTSRVVAHVQVAAGDIGKIGRSARAALEEVEFHLRGES